MEKLLYSLNYFRLKNSELSFIGAVPTTVLAGLLLLPFVFLDSANFFGYNGFINNLTTLTAALTGFYVAALVAAATFNHPDLDKVMVHGAVTLMGRPITRREFVCMIFGFLAFSAMAFTIFASAVVPLASSLPKAYPVQWFIEFDLRNAVSWIAKALSSLWISHLFVVTCLGLYYLMDRLHRQDKRILTPASNKQAA